MVVVDTNVLLYAVDTKGAHHAAARRWLDRALDGPEAVGLAWVALLAFILIATNGTIMPTPMSVDDALGQVQTWLEAPAAVVIAPTPRHPAVLRGLLGASGTSRNLTTDAHLASLALEHGATIVSYDRDFARFEGVRHRLPG